MSNSKIDTKWQNAILTPAVVADELSLKVETVRELMRQKILPAVKVGGSWRTTRRALYEYLENQMGLESGIYAKQRKSKSQGVLQVQKRSSSVGKRRKNPSDGEPKEIFFTRYGERRKTLKTLCRIAGVEPFGYHDIRHTVAKYLNDLQKVPIKKVQQVLRHRRQTTTEIYVEGNYTSTKEVLKLLEESNLKNFS